MNQYNTVAFLLIDLLPVLVSSCAIKQNTGRTKDKSVLAWDTKRLKRQYYTTDKGYRCVCANATENYDALYLWVLYQKIDHDPNNTIALCVATVVASNMLVTSNKCFANANQTLYPYDGWKKAKGKRNTIPVEDLFLTIWTHARDNPPPKQRIELEIKEVILSPGYTLSTQAKTEFPVDDIALIIVDSEFNLLRKLEPACLPRPNTKFQPTDVFYRTGIYDGVGGLVSEDPTVEPRKKLDVVTLRAKECHAEIGPEFKVTKEAICVRFRNPPPSKLGGPLYIIDAHNRTFLVGIATKIGYSQDNANFNYAYFTNLLPLVQFIERYAYLYKSLWCYAPPLNLTNELTTGHIAAKPYPWEGDYVPPPRNETLDCVCGIKNNLSLIGGGGSRIAGGQEATPYELPWMVKLYLDKPWGTSHCGASIISDRVILTAAHCVVPSNVDKPTEKDVYNASWVIPVVQVHKPPNDPFQAALTVVKVIVHPDYLQMFGTSTIDADVALLILAQPITQFIKGDVVKPIGIRPVCLPKWGENIEVVGKMAEQSGWGLTNVSDTTSLSPVLKKITFPILPLEKCIKYARAVVTNHVVCAGTLNATQTSGQGDSGGPLSIEHGEGKNKRWFQVGAVSFDSRNPTHHKNGTITFAEHPVFYANLQHYMRFIDIWSNFVGAQYCRSSV